MSSHHPSKSHTQHERGFSLIDVAVVMAIVGILLAGFLATYKMYQATRATTITEENFIIAQEALGAFIPNNNNRYPRPAPFGLKDADAQFGEEVPAGSSDIITTCNSTNTVGKVCKSNTGLNGKNVLVGLLPFADLNMPESQARDGYGRYFTYAVSEELTVNDGAKPIYGYTVDTNGDGAINSEDDPSSIEYRNHVCVNQLELDDGGGFTRVACTDQDGVNPARAIALVSHGSDGLGAWLPSGQLYASCGTVSSNEKSQSENCNFDGQFIQSVRRTTKDNGTAADTSDDYELVSPMLIRGSNDKINDDALQVEVREDGNYWGMSTSDISNKYSYKVGIGVDEPTKPLEVNGNILAEEGVLTDKLCGTKTLATDPDPDCLETAAIAGAKPEMDCGPLAMVKYIENNAVGCVTIANINSQCGPTQVLIGVNADGSPRCQEGIYPMCGTHHGGQQSGPPNGSTTQGCMPGTMTNLSGSGPWSWVCAQNSKTVNCATAP